MLARWNFGLTVAFGEFQDARVDWNALAGDSQNTKAQIDNISLALVGEPLPPEAQQIISDFVTREPEQFALPMIVALILGSPYFQFR